ncbi:hypothetical protein LINPERHAP1_LOCUS7197 [Linum perenne]
MAGMAPAAGSGGNTGRVGFGRVGMMLGRGGNPGRVGMLGRGANLGRGRVGILGRGGNVGRLGNWRSWRAAIPTLMLGKDTTTIRAKKKHKDLEDAMLVVFVIKC